MPVYNEDEYNTEDLMLTEGMKVKDLISGGANFTLQSNLQEYNEDDELFPELLTGDEGIELDNEVITSPWEQSFAELIPLMTELTLNDMDGISYTIYKKNVKPPIDNVEMSRDGRYRVMVDYNAYYERETIPFDSTRMRGSTYTFVNDDDSILPGFLAAVMSMKVDEESQFIIPYQLLYGELGCEPRVKKQADVLFVIQLIKFVDIGDEEATEKNISSEDRKKYNVMIKHVLDVKASGNDFFRRGSYVKAASAYHKAITRLAHCRLANEKEEKECEQYLKILYVNAMTVYNKLNNPKKVCSLFNELKAQFGTNTNVKALFHHGKALTSLGEFDRAKDALMRANDLKKGDRDIVDQLKDLDKKLNAYKKAELEMCRKAFQNDEPYNSAEEYSGVTEQFKISVNEYVNDFVNNPKEDKKYINIPLNNDEKKYIEDYIKHFNIKLVLPPPMVGKKVCYLSK